jgi:hypothetical protein
MRNKVRVSIGGTLTGDVTAGKELLFYLFFLIRMALTSKVLRKGTVGLYG